MDQFPIAGKLLSGLGGLLGAREQGKKLGQGRQDILNLPGVQGAQGIGGNFGQVDANGQFTQGADFANAQGALAGQIPGLLQGGLFNDAGFQQAFGQNDLAGALAQANQGFGAQAGNTAFGGLGGLNSLLQGQVAGGPQDFSGGLQNQLFGQGFSNQQQAGNQQGLFNQSLASQRAAAAPQFNRQQNSLQNSLFSKGLLGNNSTATGEAFRGLFEAQNQADLGFQNNAFGQAFQQQQFLGNLGSQQIGQGQQFLGQNLGQFNQNIGNLQGIEGQGFGQALQGLGFNASQGQNRLNAAQGLFGLGQSAFGQGVGLGQSGAQGLLGFGSLGLQAARSPQELQASLLQGSGDFASALTSQSQAQAGAGGGLFSGLGSSLGGLFKTAGTVGKIAGLFSDERLKDNIKRIGHLGKLGWYEWTWNDIAKSMGIDAPTYGVIAQEVLKHSPEAVITDKKSGYLMVDYTQIVGA